MNECVTDTHTCQRGEHCVNTVGSFKCLQELSCQPGYELKDGECVGKTSVFQLMQLPSPERKGKGLQSILLLLVCDIRVVTKKRQIVMEIFGFIGPFCTLSYWN